MPHNNLEADRPRALSLVPVSRETEARLAIYVELLLKWQRIKNLVAPSTLPAIWTRHIADSAQLLDFAPEARSWVDIGSGAGFPGMVLAIQLADEPGAVVHLVESDQGKCAFLRAVASATSAAARVHAGRIESVLPTIERADVVTARALAPLPQLVDYGRNLLTHGAIGLFLKGRSVEAELTGHAALRNFRLDRVASRTDPAASIIVVRALDTSLAP